MRRVVVTGLGMVSPLGLDVESSWKALLAGECGIGPITEFDASEFGCRIAGEVKNFDPAAGGLQAKEARRYDRYVQFAAAAATEALKDAGLDFVGKNEEGDRAGCIIGSGIGGLETICVNHKAMLERGPRRISPFMIPGCIINMASVVGVSGNAGQCNYSASKAGLIGLAKSIAKELGPRGIRANAIAPGFIITDMTNALSDEIKEQWAKQIPLRRGGTPDDVAKVALFLASDLSSYVSGQVIHVCGAMNT